MKFALFLRSVFQPLPDPKCEADKLFTSPLHYLSFEDTKDIIRTVIDEARKSREFGLFIKKGCLEKEELFFCATFNALGGPVYMRKNVSFSDAEAAISELMWNHFGQEVEYYFKLAVKKN